mgnify:CR=1 FL=1
MIVTHQGNDSVSMRFYLLAYCVINDITKIKHHCESYIRTTF